MADKKTGFERAAEADMKSKADEMVACVKKADANGDLTPPKSKKAPRKVARDFRAMSQIDSLLEEFPPMTAMRILRYCMDKQGERHLRPIAASNYCDENVKRDSRREPGGDLYTPPLPGLDNG